MGVKVEGRRTRIGVRALRVILGLGLGHRPSAHALCVGATLRGQRHTAATPGAGGMRNVDWQNSFVAASASCGQSVPKVVRR